MADEGQKADPKADHRARKRAGQQRLAAARAASSIPIAPVLNIGGRPRSLDPDQETLNKNMIQIVGLGAVQAPMPMVAAVLGVHIDTLTNFWLRYPDALEKFNDAKQQGKAKVRQHLWDHAKVDPPSAFKLASIIEPDEMQDPHKVAMLEVRREEARLRREALAAGQSTGGPPINVRSLSAQQLAALLERIREVKSGIAGAARDITPPVAPAKTG